MPSVYATLYLIRSNNDPQTETQVRMWLWLGGRNGIETAIKAFVRNFSRKCALNLRKINPRVPQQEAASISEALYHIIKHHGPFTVSNTWNHAKEEILFRVCFEERVDTVLLSCRHHIICSIMRGKKNCVVCVPTNHLYIGDIFLVNAKDVIRHVPMFRQTSGCQICTGACAYVLGWRSPTQMSSKLWPLGLLAYSMNDG